MGQEKKRPTFFNIPVDLDNKDVKSNQMDTLAGLRSIVDKGGPSKPVTSTPRVTGSLTSGIGSKENPIETPMGRLLGLAETATDISNLGVGGAASTAGLPFAAYKNMKGFPPRIVHGTQKSFDYFDPNRNDAGDVLGWLTHFAENPEYAGKYATGGMKGQAMPEYNIENADLKLYGKRLNPNLILTHPEAKNVLDLVDPNADDIAQAMAFAENKEQLKGLFKRARSYEPSFKHGAHFDAPTEEWPIRQIAENIRFSPETTENMPWDAIRYHDVNEKSWAIPARTPLYSEFGAPLTKESHTIPISPIKMLRQDELSTGNFPELANRAKYSGKNYRYDPKTKEYVEKMPWEQPPAPEHVFKIGDTVKDNYGITYKIKDNTTLDNVTKMYEDGVDIKKINSPVTGGFDPYEPLPPAGAKTSSATKWKNPSPPSEDNLFGAQFSPSDFVSSYKTKEEALKEAGKMHMKGEISDKDLNDIMDAADNFFGFGKYGDIWNMDYNPIPIKEKKTFKIGDNVTVEGISELTNKTITSQNELDAVNHYYKYEGGGVVINHPKLSGTGWTAGQNKPKYPYVKPDYDMKTNQYLLSIGTKKFPQTSVGLGMAKKEIKDMIDNSVISLKEGQEYFKQLAKYKPKGVK